MAFREATAMVTATVMVVTLTTAHLSPHTRSTATRLAHPLSASLLHPRRDLAAEAFLAFQALRPLPARLVRQVLPSLLARLVRQDFLLLQVLTRMELPSSQAALMATLARPPS